MEGFQYGRNIILVAIDNFRGVHNICISSLQKLKSRSNTLADIFPLLVQFKLRRKTTISVIILYFEQQSLKSIKAGNDTLACVEN